MGEPNSPVRFIMYGEPSDRSLLRKTLPEIFGITGEDQTTLRESFGNKSLAELEFAAGEWERLSYYSIYPDDYLDSLLSYSLGYVVSIWNNDYYLTELLRHFLRLVSSVLGYQPQLLDFNSFDSTLILKNDNMAKAYDIYLPPQIITQELFKVLHDAGYTKWNQLAKLSECSIIENLGFNVSALQIIQALWLLRPTTEMLAEIMLLSDEEHNHWRSLNSIIGGLVAKEPGALSGAEARGVHILLRRMGTYNKPPATLEEIGLEIGVTRERVRQIEKRFREKLEKPSSLQKLKPLWLVLSSLLFEAGGIIALSDLPSKLKDIFDWAELPAVTTISGIISLNPGLVVDANSEAVFFKNLSCAKCGKVGMYLEQVVKDAGMIKAIDAGHRLSSICRKNCETAAHSSASFAPAFIEFLVSSLGTQKNRIRAQNGTLYGAVTWRLRYGSLSSAAEAVLETSGRPMHNSEVYGELKQYRQDLESLNERNVYASLERSKNLLLWDAGTFMHKKHAPFPFSLIRKIEDWNWVRLNENIPFISAYGAFKTFNSKCMLEGITSEYALYSCLRESADEKFVYPYFPYIYLSKDFSQRLSITLVLEEWLQEAGGDVPYEELKSFAVNKLFIKEFMWNQYSAK
ncbi:MAG: hypothetical protein IBX64_09810, partial [Actinobacteria bacterium]|nr:hypothetical protein [Actinomycetota bacterium]